MLHLLLLDILPVERENRGLEQEFFKLDQGKVRERMKTDAHVDEQREEQLVLAAPSEGYSIIQVQPEDDVEAVLNAIVRAAQPVILVLPERGTAFTLAEHFIRARQAALPPIVSFVIPKARMVTIGRLCYGQEFHFTSDVSKAQAVFQQRFGSKTVVAEPLSPVPPDVMPGVQRSLLPSREAPARNEAHNKATRRRRSPRHSTHFVPFVALLAILLVAGSAFVFPPFGQQGMASLIVPGQATTVAGQLSFASSGQLDPNSASGINDMVTLRLNSVTSPPAGMTLYAWLLADETQETMAPIMLGALPVRGGSAQISYQDPHHANLLATYSRFLVTEQASTPPPDAPPLDAKTWKYQGSIPNTPSPGDVQGFSLLSHMRHLLAKDPTLAALNLSGGLDIWLYRNTGKLFEWSNAARDDWGGNNTDVLLRLVDRVIQYLDGEAYAWQDLPPGTPWLVDAKAGRIGLIDVAGPAQQMPSFVSHVRRHLAGMMNAPGHSVAQKLLAGKVDDSLSRIEMLLRKVRSDAMQLAKMTSGQVKGPMALTLLNDMQVNASDAYIGSNPLEVATSGVIGVHSSLQTLASISVMSVT